jgi:hypothetical protein
MAIFDPGEISVSFLILFDVSGDEMKFIRFRTDGKARGNFPNVNGTQNRAKYGALSYGTPISETSVGALHIADAAIRDCNAYTVIYTAEALLEVTRVDFVANMRTTSP